VKASLWRRLNGVAVTGNKLRSARLCLLAAALAAGAGLARAQLSPPAPTPDLPAAMQTPAAQVPATQAPVATAVPAPAGQPSASAPQGVAATETPPPAKRGFLDDVGKWWDDSVASFNAKLKEQQLKLDESNKKSSEAMKDAAAATQQAMKNAADAMVHLGTSKMIEVHEVCAIAGNGAPDCQTAATNACRGKGFSGGQPLDIRTAEKCTASLWVSGQAPTPGACPVETVVLRAACQ
jgi:hypothetical protein